MLNKNILKEYTPKVSKNIKWNIIKKNSMLQTEELINIRNELNMSKESDVISKPKKMVYTNNKSSK